jgi:excalibur calcium-binding domain-containing protein
MRRLLASLCFAFVLAACGATSQTADPPPTATAAAPISTSTAPPPTPAQNVAHHVRSHRPKSHAASSASGLPYSTASGHQVQPQPAPGACHATGHGLYSSPDPHCTPGALNPAVKQSTIDQTICVSGYTKTIRPSASVTDREKLASMAAYGDGGRSPHDFEYDHLVSLELGGAVNDPRNLWPEPGASPNPKDSVEGHLHSLVCDGQMPLAQAQHIIATGWISYARAHAGSPPARTPAPTATHPASPPASSTGPNKPISEINCSDFSTHAAAQQWFTAHGGSSSNDVAGLDGDHDGLACESLP